MLSLYVIFWIFLVFFVVVGALRGWTRELVAASGLVLSLFALQTFGPPFMNVIGLADPTAVGVDPNLMYRRQFYILTAFHLFIAFISFQGPAVSRLIGTRLKRSDNVQDKLLGAIFGALNGWLVVGTVFSFLEYRIERTVINDNALAYVRLGAGVQYPFSLQTITRPADALTSVIFQYLPLGILTTNTYILPFILVALILVILIAVV